MGIKLLTQTRKPLLFAVTSSRNGLRKPGIKNWAAGEEVSDLVSATSRISTCSQTKFDMPENLLRTVVYIHIR